MLSLEELIDTVPAGEGQETADYYKDTIIPAMNKLRKVADEIETLVGEKYWPYPTYGELLFKI